MKTFITSRHSFHLVTTSPWPLLAALSAFLLTFGFVLYLHGFLNGAFVYLTGLWLLIFIMFCWWRDVLREATFEGQHTVNVQKGLKYGVLLFIVSEVMFFFGFFWAFFHSSLNPSISLGAVWPPAFMHILNPWEIPLLNTLLLLTSGATITWAHSSIIWGSKIQSHVSLISTVVFAVIFTILQGFEYINAPFSISDGVYGSTFYLATGFHGFHVIIGTIFIFVCLIRLNLNHFTKEHHFGFEAAAWYWHFVDVVWLFLFLSIYYWGY